MTLTVDVFCDLRSIHEAIPRLCGLRLQIKRWFLQMLEPNLAILPKAPTAAMFTSTVLSYVTEPLVLLGNVVEADSTLNA